MASPEPADRSRTSSAHYDPNVQEVPWVFEGVVAGFVGAAAIAIYFFALDLIAGRPLATPNALGAVLASGAVPPPDEPIQLVLIAFYSVVHASLFVIVGLAAARELLTGTRIPGDTPRVRSLVLASFLFLLFELGSFGFAALLAPELREVSGVANVSLANLLAAWLMAAVLRSRGERLGLHPD